MKKKRNTVSVGDWAYFCCECGLRRIENKAQLDEILDDWDEMGYRAFSGRNEALDFIAMKWEESGMPDRAKWAESLKTTA